ncbi:MAG: HEAT repeat domain-containing protein [Bryobacteraceae bacterium]
MATRFPVILLLAALSLAAQPRIGIIDFYGRHKVTEDQIRVALAAKEGSPLPKSKGETEERIEQIPGVVRAHLEATCCEKGQAILYVGVEEKGSHHFDFNDAPSGAVVLPQEIHDEYSHFLAAVSSAVRAGETGEDLHLGHSLMQNADARRHQERFVTIAKDNIEKLRDVLKNSADEEHRAIAAYVIGYYPDKASVVNDLQSAVRDPDDTTRNNAIRALAAIAIFAIQQPDAEVKVSPTWFIEMLDSLIWSDRHAAAVTLVTLTEARNPQVLDHIRERAMSTLAEMARWKHLPHALPAFILLGRASGIDEREIEHTWSEGDRQAFISKIMKPGKK